MDYHIFFIIDGFLFFFHIYFLLNEEYGNINF